MSIIDAKLLFSDDQAITATADSTNTLNFGTGEDWAGNTTAKNYGTGNPQYVIVQVTEDFATLTSLTVKLQDSADNSSFATIEDSEAIVAADLVAGKRIKILLPDECRQYVKLNYTVAGSNATAGKVVSFLGWE